MGNLRFDLYAAGVLTPAFSSLADVRAACRRGQPPATAAPFALPSPMALPANDRRRTSQVVRLTLACIEQTLQSSPFPGETIRSVFATDEGTGEVCQQLLETLATTRQVSPLLFPNSVLNAPSGYFSIARRNRQPITVVSQGLQSFAGGLLCAVTETVATRQPVLLVAYDPAMTSPLDELLAVTEPAATAWILSAALAPEDIEPLGSFALNLESASAAQESPLPAWLPPRLLNNSSARALAALGLLEAQPEAVFRMTLGNQVLAMRRTRRDIA